MARRAKGPTPEELIEKLQKDFEAFKEESKERTDEIERKSEEQIELVKDEYEKNCHLWALEERCGLHQPQVKIVQFQKANHLFQKLDLQAQGQKRLVLRHQQAEQQVFDLVRLLLP